MRYINLSTILVYRLVSQKVMARFPDYDSLIKAKLMLPNEVKRLEKTDQKTPHESTWTPILWAMKLLTRARTERKIEVILLEKVFFYSHILFFLAFQGNVLHR